MQSDSEPPDMWTRRHRSCRFGLVARGEDLGVRDGLQVVKAVQERCQRSAIRRKSDREASGHFGAEA